MPETGEKETSCILAPALTSKDTVSPNKSAVNMEEKVTDPSDFLHKHEWMAFNLSKYK